MWGIICLEQEQFGHALDAKARESETVAPAAVATVTAKSSLQTVEHRGHDFTRPHDKMRTTIPTSIEVAQHS